MEKVEDNATPENNYSDVVYAGNGLVVRYLPPEVRERDGMVSVKMGKLEFTVKGESTILEITEALYLAYIIEKVVIEDYENAQAMRSIGASIVKGIDEPSGYA